VHGVRQVRQGGRGQGRDASEQALALEAWLRRAGRVGPASGGSMLVRLAQDLERVPAGKAVAESARAVRAVEALLERASACEGVRLLSFLGVFTRHSSFTPA
jgi:hypothetical protein